MIFAVISVGTTLCGSDSVLRASKSLFSRLHSFTEAMRAPRKERVTELQISFEIASEAPGFSANYPSDIHFSINGIDLGYWTTPGEYNDRRGLFTPDWWFLNLGQYGKVKMLSVNSQGTFIDGFAISDTTVDQLNITANSEISFVISSPKDAVNCGGLTLFGKNFGDYNQGIVINMLYEKPTAK